MAKTSVFSKPMPNASLPRNSFSRGFVSNLDWSAGMILPVFVKEVPKGTHGRINRSIFMRTASVNTAAFPKIDNHIDFFKVPLRLLMTRYNEFGLNIDDNNSSAFIESNGTFNVPATAPYFQRSAVTSVLGTLASPSQSYFDDMGSALCFGAYRLLDLLGYDAGHCFTPAQSGQSPAVGDPWEHDFNAFRLLAYQKIYYDHYRNTAYETNDPLAYNADYAYLSANGSYGYGNVFQSIDKLLKIHYVNLRKDYFTNLYPALNYTVSTPTGINWVIPNNIGQLLVSGKDVVTSFDSGTVVAIGTSNSATNQTNLNNRGGVSLGKAPDIFSSGISVQSIRAAFALDKLMRASSYAPKHVRDQIEARFGVKCKKSYGFESEYLGSFMNDIIIGEVTSTADTDSGTSGQKLGAIGGKGVSASGFQKDIEFDTYEDDCIIMGVMYTLCRSVYDSTRIDRHNTKFSREDYIQPEFMNLSLQPVYQYEIETLYHASGASAADRNNIIRGYQPRYQEFKTSIDENHMLFNYPGMLRTFVPHFNLSLTNAQRLNTPGVNLAYFKMFPTHLDTIFVTLYNPSDFTSDQFYGHLEFKFDVRQNLSVHGIPSL